MRILLLSWHWVEYLIELGNALADRGHDVHIALKTDRVYETVGADLEALVSPRVEYHLLDDRSLGLRDPRQLLCIGKMIRLFRSLRPDVVSLHDAGQTYIPLVLRSLGETPIVLTVHDVEPHPGFDSIEPHRRKRVRGYLRRRAAAVIVHGDKLKVKYLARYGGSVAVHSIPHGCYTTFAHWAGEHVEAIPDSALFFGRLHENKGLAILLAASKMVIRQIPGFKLIIAGTGADLEKRRSELESLEYCLVHDGYLPNKLVAEIFQQVSIVALPYLEGSQSGVVRIAYVFGKPVIVTDVGSLPECVKNGETGIVIPPRRPDLLAASIIELLTDDAKRIRMSKAAARMPSEDLSWARVAEQTERVFENVRGNKPS